MGVTGLDRPDKEHGPGLEPAVDWYRLGDDGAGYATKRVTDFV